MTLEVFSSLNDSVTQMEQIPFISCEAWWKTCREISKLSFKNKGEKKEV